MKTLLLTFILVLGCGSKDGGDSGSSTSAATVAPTPDPSLALVGTWKSACLGNLILVFDYAADGTMVIVLNDFVDAACTEPDLTDTVYRTYKISSSNVDYVVVKNTFQIPKQETVDQFNQNSVFGYSNWILNVPKDVTGLPDTSSNGFFSFNKGSMLFQIFKIEGSNLYFGDTNGNYDGTSKDKRPIAYDMSRPFTKQ